MIALLGGFMLIAIIWWVARRLIAVALLVVVAVIASVWLMGHRSPKPGVSGPPSLNQVQRAVSHDVTAVLRRDGMVHSAHQHR